MKASRIRSTSPCAGGNDGKLVNVRDVFAADLGRELGVEYMDCRACLVYLNGQYWGVYYMREKVNKYYIAQYYGIEDTGSIDQLVGDVTAFAGDNADYKALVEFCKSNSLADQENFGYVASQIDVDTTWTGASWRYFSATSPLVTSSSGGRRRRE